MERTNPSTRAPALGRKDLGRRSFLPKVGPTCLFPLRILIAALLAVPALCAAESPEEKGLAIVQEADRRYSGYGDLAASFRMILRNKQGQVSERELRVRTLEVPEGGTRSLCVFDSPADVKGTVLLTHTHKHKADDQWLYLPALERVRRIAAQNKSGSFMGSEFSYEDFATPVIEKYTYRWLRDEAYAEQDCHVIERRPIDKRNSGYLRQVVWMDAEHLRMLKVDYYDRKDSLLKTLTFRDYQQYAGRPAAGEGQENPDRFWRPGEMSMVNHQTGKSSRLLWSDYAFRAGLSESEFNPQNLTRIR